MFFSTVSRSFLSGWTEVVLGGFFIVGFTGRFAEAPDSTISQEKRKNAVTMKPSLFFCPEPFQPFFCLFFYFTCYPKKGGKLVLVFRHVYRFLDIRTTRTPTMMIATSKPITAGTKYMSAIDCGAGVGAGVAAGSSMTTKTVSACDGQ